MFTFLVTQSLRNRVLVLALSIALVAFGTFSVLRLPVDVLPDLNRPTVTVMTEAPGRTPERATSKVARVFPLAILAIPDRQPRHPRRCRPAW